MDNLKILFYLLQDGCSHSEFGLLGRVESRASANAWQTVLQQFCLHLKTCLSGP